MNDKKKRNIIIGSLCAVVLLMTVGYAAFQTVLKIEGTSTISSNWDVRIIGITTKNIVGSASNNGEPLFEDLTATFKTNLESPGDSIEYDITIKNLGPLTAKLDKITLSDTNNPAIKFTSSGVIEGDVLNAGSVTTLTVKVEFLSGVTEMPNSKISILNVALDYVQVTSEGGGENTAADMLKEKVVTTGDGLYEDTTETGRYVYRGASPLNYIKFNKETYRILSVEADNTIKIIREDKLDTLMAYDTKEARPQDGYCTDSVYYGCNLWGSKTTMLDANGQNVTQMAYNLRVPSNKYNLPGKEATLNTYLNTTYYERLTADAKSQITNNMFNAGVLKLATGQTLETDVSQEKANKWNGNIGLIEATDYVKASINSSCTNVKDANDSYNKCKMENYLYKSGYDWCTLTPSSYSGSYVIWYVSLSGHLLYDIADTSRGVRPVVHLKSDITLSGEGTKAKPYTIG